jgi:endonuclease YncB( thermonuclease family)
MRRGETCLRASRSIFDVNQQEKTMRRRIQGIAAALALAALPIVSVHAGDSFVGRVTEVKSANVITMVQGDVVYDVRINGIVIDKDATLARNARGALSKLVLNKVVRLRFDGRDGELMTGRIWIGGIEKPEEGIKDLGVEMVRAGLVRADANYSKYRYGQMQVAEDEARQSRRGLWR